MFVSRPASKSVFPFVLALAMLAVPVGLAACGDGDVLPPPTSDRVADDDGVLGEEDPSDGPGSSGNADAGGGNADAGGGADASTATDAATDAAPSGDAGDAG